MAEFTPVPLQGDAPKDVPRDSAANRFTPALLRRRRPPCGVGEEGSRRSAPTLERDGIGKAVFVSPFRATVSGDRSLHRPVCGDARSRTSAPGGVGSAIAVAAQRRDFFEHCVVADIDAHPRGRGRRPACPTTRASSPRPVDAFGQGCDRRARARASKATAIVNACDPRFNPADLRRRVRDRLHVPRHGDAPVGTASRGAVHERRA